VEYAYNFKELYLYYIMTEHSKDSNNKKSKDNPGNKSHHVIATQPTILHSEISDEIDPAKYIPKLKHVESSKPIPKPQITMDLSEQFIEPGSEESKRITSENESVTEMFSNTGPLTGVLFENKYKIGELLGEGGMGQVYKATHVMMKKNVAIKILLPAFGEKVDIVERFRREAESTARLAHENIITVQDFGQTAEGTFYLVMEFIEGITLSNIIYTDEINWRRACRIMNQILSALETAHNSNIIHRDLKPDNIMVFLKEGGEETIKILDFGIAKLTEPDGAGLEVTHAGMIFGTPSYISPEQALGLEVSYASDIYSASVILFEMVCGQLPFSADTSMSLMSQHINVAPPRPRSINGEIPYKLDSIILKGLDKKPKNRPRNAYDMRSVIANLINEKGFRTTVKFSIGNRIQDALFNRIGKILMGLGAIAILATIYLLMFINPEKTYEKKQQKPTVNLKSTSTVMMLIKAGKYKEALTIAKENQKTDPSNTQNAKELNYVREKIVEKAKKGMPDEMLSLAKVKELEKFIYKLRKYIGWFPKDGDLHYHITFAYLKIKNTKRSLNSLQKALLVKADLRKKVDVQKYLNDHMAHKKYWVRHKTLTIIKEAFAKDKNKALKFLETTINNNKVDADDRYTIFLFVQGNGLKPVLKEHNFWKSQLRWSTKCTIKKSASNWFIKNAVKKDLPFLITEYKRGYYLTGNARKASTKCYKSLVGQAISVFDKKIVSEIDRKEKIYNAKEKKRLKKLEKIKRRNKRRKKRRKKRKK
jgi:serine/threonine protein kinase